MVWISFILIVFGVLYGYLILIKNIPTSYLTGKKNNTDNKLRKEKERQLKAKIKKFDPFFFIPNNAFGGFLVLLFLTWLIFGVIFDIGPDLGPPKFFGHDGG